MSEFYRFPQWSLTALVMVVGDAVSCDQIDRKIDQHGEQCRRRKEDEALEIETDTALPNALPDTVNVLALGIVVTPLIVPLPLLFPMI